MSAVYEKLDEYTADLVREGWIKEPMRNFALALEAFVHLAQPGMMRCDAGPTDDGILILTWDKEPVHLEAEIKHEGDVEWFFRDRRNQDVGLQIIEHSEWGDGIGKLMPDWDGIYEDLAIEGGAGG